MSNIMYGVLHTIDAAEAKEERLRERLQAIKLKTGFKEEHDEEERVELAAERVIAILRDVRGQMRSTDADRKRLALCIDLIASNKLYDTSTKQVKDKETANWLDDLLEVDKTKRSRSATTTAGILAGGTTTDVPGVVVRRASITGEASALLSSDVREQLKTLPSWGYDLWDLAAVTDEKPLAVAVNRIFELKGLFGKLKIDRLRMTGFLKALEAMYLPTNPYHNAVHGADVAHGMFWLLDFSPAQPFVGPLDQLACVIAAAMHDVRHPGVNNSFLARTMHPLALQYNDKAILESMHASEGMKLAFSDEHDIFGELSDSDRKHVRKYIIELILATDMTRHFEIQNQFSTTFAAPPSGEMKEDDHLTMLRLVMKMADVSNPAKPVKVAVKWTERVIEEFFSQGDQERAAGLEISPFMDRATTDIPKTQVGFISFMVEPMWKVFDRVFPVPEPIHCLGETRAYWEAKQKTSATAVQDVEEEAA